MSRYRYSLSIYYGRSFYRCAGDIKPGDVIGLADGTLWRIDFGGWKQLPQIH
jgi:hypothetical protein